MALAFKEFAIPFALLLIAVLVYLLIIGKLNGFAFAGSLVGVGILVAIVELFRTGPGQQKEANDFRRKLVDLLLNSRIGTAQANTETLLRTIGAWTEDVRTRITEFDTFRQTGVLAARHTGPEEE